MLEKYLNQDIDNPVYLFHGSPKRLDKLSPKLSNDSNGNDINIATAVFLFPSFLMATPYAFKDTIKENSYELEWNFKITKNHDYPLMIMENVIIDEEIRGYIYVFTKEHSMIKDNDSYQYKCFEELIPIDRIEVCYKDYKKYFINKD